MSDHNRGRGPGGRGGTHDRDDAELEHFIRPEGTVTYFTAAAQPGRRRTVRAELLDKEAYKTAEAMQKLPPTQLRRFYADVLVLKRELEIDPDGTSNELVQARMALLKAHIAYTARRKGKQIPPEFIALMKFIKQHVATVTTKEDFLEGFVPCFEAVVAYHKYFAKDS